MGKLDSRKTSQSPEVASTESKAVFSGGDEAVASSTTEKHLMAGDSTSGVAGILRKSSQDGIAGFMLEGWYVFDSYAPFQIEWKGRLWPTAEHAFQAAHFFETNPELAEQVRLARSPREADDLANENKQFDDPKWREKRIAIMEEIIRAKYEQHPLIQETLKKSVGRRIVETNNRDAFWGWGPDRNGENTLGNIWMKLRDDIVQGS